MEACDFVRFLKFYDLQTSCNTRLYNERYFCHDKKNKIVKNIQEYLLFFLEMP